MASHLKKSHRFLQKYKCLRCDVVSKDEKRIKKHEQISKNITKLKFCDNCNFKSCTSRALGHHKRLKLNSRLHSKHPILQNTSKKIDTPEKISLPENYSKPTVFDNEFKCAKCGMAFYFQKGYQKHIETVESPSVCNHCNFTSCTSLGLRRHENMVHEGLKLSANLPQSEPTLAPKSPNFKPSADQESQSVQKPPVKYVLPKPKKGQWIVVLEKLDASNKDSSINHTSNLDESFQTESKLNEIFELDTSIPNNYFEEIVIKEEWDEHEEMDSVIDMKI